MHLKRHFKVTMNLKKIIRIKRDLGLVTSIRKRSKMRLILKSGEEHRFAPNLVQRDFVPITKRTVFSTDITELPYLGGRKAYLSAVKDLATNEIVHYHLCPRPTGDLVISNFEKVFKRFSLRAREKMIIHSDQGTHFTSIAYRSMLQRFGITQSMSRRGNCLDNAPIESFFGHLKDEVSFRSCKTYEEVRKQIEDYVEYYNYERPQWGLKQKTPAEAGVKLSLF